MKFLIFSFLLVLVLLIGDAEILAGLYSLCLLITIAVDFKRDKKITYITIYNLAFIFIVCSEIITSSAYFNYSNFSVIRYILVSNILINLGFTFKLRVNTPKKINSIKISNLKGRKIFTFFLILSFVYFALFIGQSLQSFREGRYSAMVALRETGGSSFFKNILANVGSLIPIMATYYFRYALDYKMKAKYALILILCVIPQILWGTRYILLFSLIAPVLILFDRKKLNFALISKLLIAFTLLLGLITYIRYNRDTTSSAQVVDNSNLVTKIASFGSDEGVVKGAVNIFEYTDIHGFSYGKESAFALYFWVPRSIWPSKPEQLSYWLVRTYSNNLAEVFSAAYGYWGELYMDFGYFSLFFFFSFGVLLKKLELLKDIHLSQNSFKSIIYIVIFPFLFIAVRSPQTAIISTTFILLLYYLLSLYFKKMKYVIS